MKTSDFIHILVTTMLTMVLVSTTCLAGDVNGDGYDDVIVGAVGYDAGGLCNVGRASVYHGSAS